MILILYGYGRFDPVGIKADFSLPDGVEPINILGVGHRGEERKSPDRHETERKPLSDTVRFETF